MQISRHWRLNAQRYRLEGFRATNGEVSLQARPSAASEAQANATQEAHAAVVHEVKEVATSAA